MFSEFKSYEAFFYGLCDATFFEVWCLGSLGVIPKIYLFSLILLFTVTGHITIHSNPNLDFHLCFHSNPINPCPLWKPYNPYCFIAYSPPKPNHNSSKPKLYQICPGVLNQITLFPLVLHHYYWWRKLHECCVIFHGPRLYDLSFRLNLILNYIKWLG